MVLVADGADHDDDSMDAVTEKIRYNVFSLLTATDYGTHMIGNIKEGWVIYAFDEPTELVGKVFGERRDLNRLIKCLKTRGEWNGEQLLRIVP